MEWWHSGCKNPLEKFPPLFFGIKAASSSLIIFQRAKLSTHLGLPQLKGILKEKRHRKVTKGVLFLHNNAPAHRPLATQKKLSYLGFQCLDHPPHSPDLAPSDYHLFPGLKKKVPIFYQTRRSLLPWRPGCTYNFLNFFERLEKVREWAKKCIELHGEYVE